MKRYAVVLSLTSIGLFACTTTSEQGTLAELQHVPPDIDEVYLEDSLDRAAQSYRRYLEESPKSARTPEAMRRLADLQIEQAYGVIGSGEFVEMAAPEVASQSALPRPVRHGQLAVHHGERLRVADARVQRKRRWPDLQAVHLVVRGQPAAVAVVVPETQAGGEGPPQDKVPLVQGDDLAAGLEVVTDDTNLGSVGDPVAGNPTQATVIAPEEQLLP